MAVSSSAFRPPNISHLKYAVEVLHRPSVLDKTKHWEIFEDDQQMKRFFEMVNEFSAICIDSDEESDNKGDPKGEHTEKE